MFGPLGGGRVESDDSDDGLDGAGGVLARWGRLMKDLWIEPKHHVVARALERWWWRWILLVGLPAALVSASARLGEMGREGGVGELFC